MTLRGLQFLPLVFIYFTSFRPLLKKTSSQRPSFSTHSVASVPLILFYCSSVYHTSQKCHALLLVESGSPQMLYQESRALLAPFCRPRGRAMLSALRCSPNVCWIIFTIQLKCFGFNLLYYKSITSSFFKCVSPIISVTLSFRFSLHLYSILPILTQRLFSNSFLYGWSLSPLHDSLFGPPPMWSYLNPLSSVTICSRTS